MADETETRTAPERLVSWARDHQLWDHVEEHLEACRWPRRCPHPLCGASTFEDAGAFRFHLVDEHRLGRARAKKPPHATTTDEHPDPNLVDDKTPLANSTRKRKQPPSTKALQWMPLHASRNGGVVVEEAASPRAPKRHQRSPPAICPAALSLQQDVTGDHTANSVKPSPMLLDPHLSGNESDETLIEYGCYSPAHPCASRDSASLAPASEVDDDDSLFSQFLRSPSPSPVISSDDTSCTTLAALAKEVTGLPKGWRGPNVAGVVPLNEESAVQDEAGHCHPRTVQRIRLRVSQPKVTLRLRLSDTGRNEDNASTASKERGKKRARGGKQYTRRNKGRRRGREEGGAH